MHLIISLVQLYVILAFLLAASFSTNKAMDYLEHSFIQEEDYTKRSSLVLVVDVVLRLTAIAFVLFYLPVEFVHLNKTMLHGSFEEELIKSSAVMYAITTVALDTGMVSKINVLKERFNTALISQMEYES